MTKGIHRHIIRAVEKNMPDPALLSALSGLFKLFGDPTRISILWALSESEMCVCDLAAFIGLSESAVSHQLRRLKDLALVKSRRDGQIIYYALDDAHVSALLEVGLAHIRE